jgi:hypothetical protein
MTPLLAGTRVRKLNYESYWDALITSETTCCPRALCRPTLRESPDSVIIVRYIYVSFTFFVGYALQAYLTFAPSIHTYV